MSSCARSASRGRSVWEAGTNTRTPLTLTTTPPLFSSVTTPSRTDSLSTASSTAFHILAASRRFLESIAVPSTSLTLTTTASMVSPTLTASSTLMPSSVNSEVGMKPEYLAPRSTLISVPVIATTTPVTLSPLYIVLRVSSSISSKDFSFSTADSSTLISSLILFLTSLIIHAGVDAPAVSPTVSAVFSLSISRASALSINSTHGQCSLHISARCTLFALCLPPMTTMASQSEASLAASS